MNTKDIKTRIYRWSLLLQEYDFDIVHIKGIQNYTDYLSRGFKFNMLEEENGKVEILDKNKQIRIMEHYHEATGHAGKATLRYLLKQKYEWKSMDKRCKEMIDNCQIYEMDSRVKGQSEILASRIETARKRWEIDLIGPMPGGGYILSAIDVFTRFAATRAVRDKSSGRVIKALADIIRNTGPPECILADNGR